MRSFHQNLAFSRQRPATLEFPHPAYASYPQQETERLSTLPFSTNITKVVDPASRSDPDPDPYAEPSLTSTAQTETTTTIDQNEIDPTNPSNFTPTLFTHILYPRPYPYPESSVPPPRKMAHLLHLVARQVAADGGNEGTIQVPITGTPGHCDTGNEYNGDLGLRISAIFVIMVGSLFGMRNSPLTCMKR